MWESHYRSTVSSLKPDWKVKAMSCGNWNLKASDVSGASLARPVFSRPKYLNLSSAHLSSSLGPDLVSQCNKLSAKHSSLKLYRLCDSIHFWLTRVLMYVGLMYVMYVGLCSTNVCRPSTKECRPDISHAWSNFCFLIHFLSKKVTLLDLCY